MKLKVECPNCAKTCLLHVYYLRTLVTCPACRSDFVPVRDAFLTCPECGSIVAARKSFRSRKLSCVRCGFEVPESTLDTLKRRMRRLLSISLIDPTTLPFLLRR